MSIDTRSINDLTDAELAGMVRRGAYAANTTFGPGDSRFLLVLAVPYGDRDGIEDLPSALEAFFALVQDSDYRERNFEVYDHNAGQRYFDARLEDVEANRDDEPRCAACGGVIGLDGIEDTCADCCDEEIKCPECGVVGGGHRTECNGAHEARQGC